MQTGGNTIDTAAARAAAFPHQGAAQAAGPALANAAIELNNVFFSYPSASTYVLEGIDLKVQKGEIVVLIGPSGCGKSTVLNLITGLFPPSSGAVRSNGEVIDGLNQRVTYMTQKDTLLPWRSAIENAALPLEIKGVSKRERNERAREVLRRVGIGDHENSRPHQLSGGMRSRLSLARALLSDSDIMLLDEPFAAIDALLRVRLQQLLISVWEQTQRTMIYVTHDLNEAIALGHRVIVMSTRPGRIVLEKRVDAPQPRDVAAFRKTAMAQELYVELWDELERQIPK